ncbi:MAG: PSD1 and planctomycete cytochrome C domain-containing protein [Pirellulales bacterium]
MAQSESDTLHVMQIAQGTKLFKQQVRGLLIQQCLNCHGGEDVEAELDISTRAGFLKGGESGKPAFVPGNSKQSLVMKLLHHQIEPEMPLDSGKLSDNQIADIARWIDLEAPYDKPLKEAEAPLLDWTQTRVPDSEKDYWAFQPLKSFPPSVSIDSYVQSKQQEIGTGLNAIADDRILIRRLYLDLLGIPPSPEEINQYLQDNSTDKYESLVNRLLDDPRYGERWARHWLDVSRFAESHGFEHDYDRPFAFHYRDFVIKALNQDMPYNQFVRWQIAGDEIAPDQPLAVMATGFLGAGVYPTQITANEVERVRYDALDDMVATIGTGFLGLTIGCARCHDHKFDPIPQADYYRMASAFTKAVRANVELPITEVDPEELRKYETKHKALIQKIEHFEKTSLTNSFAKWEAELQGTIPATGWINADIIEFKSEGGARLTKLKDGSVLASGTNPAFDTYTVTAITTFQSISALRIETLADKSLPRVGPGRAGNGNFALSNLSVIAEPINGKSEAVTVQFTRAKATFDRSNLESWKAIDDDPKSAWALDPHIGEDHFALFQTAEDFGFTGGTKLRIEMKFNNNTGHNFGRFRIGVTNAIRPVELEQKGPSAEIVQLLSVPSSERSAAQSQKFIDWYKKIDKGYRQLQQELSVVEKSKPKAVTTQVMIVSEGVKAIRHHTQGGDFLNETHFLKRGDSDQKVAVAAPGFLQVLNRHPDGQEHWQEKPQEGVVTSYKRRSMSNWMVDVDSGAGHLVARVLVNRLWHHHMGRGLVETPNDFGNQGNPPSHPDLLDYLANQLIMQGWSTKAIHRMILTSTSYKQSSDFDETKYQVDPENLTLWRFQPRRLEAEAIRDSMLSASGLLDPTMYGKGSLDQNSRRRSIYFTVKRSKLIPMMALFDSPEPLGSIGRRSATTIAPQALAFINSPQVRAAAESLATLVSEDSEMLEEQIQNGYLRVTGKYPSTQETDWAVAFIKSQTESYQIARNKNAQQLALGDFCQVLFGLNDFIYLR